MGNLAEDLKGLIEGDVHTDDKTLDDYSHDTSLLRVRPEVVVYPKHAEDVKKIVRYAGEHKDEKPRLSITGRSAGTDMGGGPLNESIILGFTAYMNRAELDADHLSATVEPGVYYRDFEKLTDTEHIYMPAYPASKSLCALGGMIMNNSGGEKTLRYGQMRRFVDELSMVLSDGNEYTFRKLNKDELEEKKRQEDYEGEIYRRMHQLLEANFDEIQAAKPKTSKNSAGYALWDVWDREHFDLTQLFTGSQGTLGMMTRAKIRLVKEKPAKKLMVLFFKSWDHLPDVVNAVLPVGPESLEAFDDETLKLGLRFMPEIARKAGSSFIPFALRFLPEVWIGIKMLGLPRLMVLVEVVEDTEEEVDKKIKELKKAIRPFHMQYRIIPTENEAEKYWTMRRESFSLLRKHVHGKRTAPFVDDFCVLPERIPEFLPQMLSILREHGIRANIAGHAGSGNFHIIPLMDLTMETERAKIPVVAEKVYDLVIRYDGTITAEHNDGIVRTPYLRKMYGDHIYTLFREVKHLFDPQGIFNPGKKVDGSLQYFKNHIVTS